MSNKTLDDLLHQYGYELTDTQHIKLREAIRELIESVIGEDEKHPNGKKLVNPYVCNDCGTPEEPYIRNELRQEQRERLKSL